MSPVGDCDADKSWATGENIGQISAASESPVSLFKLGLYLLLLVEVNSLPDLTL